MIQEAHITFYEREHNFDDVEYVPSEPLYENPPRKIPKKLEKYKTIRYFLNSTNWFEIIEREHYI